MITRPRQNPTIVKQPRHGYRHVAYVEVFIGAASRASRKRTEEASPTIVYVTRGPRVDRSTVLVGDCSQATRRLLGI